MLLDEDVIRIMMHAYGHALSLEDMKDNDDIMGTFWKEIAYGKLVIEEHLTNHTPGEDGDGSSSEDEEEEEG